MIKTYKVNLANLEMAVTEWGHRSGNPVIVLHGWLDNIASFYPLLSETKWLQQLNLRFITIDMAGHGHSSHRHQSHPCNLLEYVQDLYNLIEYFQFDTVSLIGHSLGAGIATLYAGALPDKVKSMVLIEGIIPFSEDEKSGPAQLAKSLRQRNQHKNVDKHYYEDIQPMINARAKVGDLDNDNAALLVKRNIGATAKGYSWRSDPRLRLASALYLTPGQSRAFLDNLNMPVLLLYGEDGFIKKYPAYKELISTLKTSVKTSELPGGHHLHMQYPELVREASKGFYQTVGI